MHKIHEYMPYSENLTRIPFLKRANCGLDKKTGISPFKSTGDSGVPLICETRDVGKK